MTDAFRIKLPTAAPLSAPDAETLFRNLKDRAPQVPYLWAHQADILRAYNKEYVDSSDVAIELPTGAGKTLVGLLIAEWRRAFHSERVAYLCPTRQLARQVGVKASLYGIRAHVLVGKQTDYDPADFADYLAAKAIAVTTYSGLFNVAPRIDSPEGIVLDDAHAAENYIAEMWSLSVSRSKYPDLYERVLGLFREDLPNYFLTSLSREDASTDQKQDVELLPAPRFLAKVEALTELLDEMVTSTSLRYAWELLRGKLHACNVFISWSEVTIRPWIPPSRTHAPFAEAKQRIYMSATLGAGGELERVTGVRNIDRIPVPSGWDKQGTGRRLFLFPDRRFKVDQWEPWLAKLMEPDSSGQRCLVLTPHRLGRQSFLEFVHRYGLQHELLEAPDVEESLDVFTQNSLAILLLTNRYDGIDLPGDACRMLVVYGLPVSVNLQERFLWAKLRLTSVLRDRVRTRITQAVGRCTRTPTDYAVVVILGGTDFCMKKENRAEFHPELRVELEFGLDQSAEGDLGYLLDLVQALLQKDQAWTEAEEYLVKERDEACVATPAYVKTLLDVSSPEVDCQYALWKEDFPRAFELASQVADRLSGDELAGYRALWNYFAGSAAYQVGTRTGQAKFKEIAVACFKSAAQAIHASSWFARLALDLMSVEVDQDVTDMDYVAATSIIDYLAGLGATGPKFESKAAQHRQAIGATDANTFDRALTVLGKMLGFNAHKPEGTGTPDSVWKLANHVILFECKSDESPSDGVSISTCRQAQGHKDWLREVETLTGNEEVDTVVVSPRVMLDKDAAPHSQGLKYLHVDEVRKLSDETLDCLRRIRSNTRGLSEDEAVRAVLTELSNASLLPESVLKELTGVPLRSLPKNGKDSSAGKSQPRKG